jgi:N-acetylmuramoyl-L-alanine amidase
MPIPAETIIDAIKEYWCKQDHWKNPGYHYIVGTEGRIEELLLEKGNSTPIKGYKRNAIHFSFVAGNDMSSENFKSRLEGQVQAVMNKLGELKFSYPIKIVGVLSDGSSES